jgi:hypothetical protein
MWADEATELQREGNFACLECYVQYVQPLSVSVEVQLVDVRPPTELQMVLARVQRKLRMTGVSS